MKAIYEAFALKRQDARFELEDPYAGRDYSAEAMGSAGEWMAGDEIREKILSWSSPLTYERLLRGAGLTNYNDPTEYELGWDADLAHRKHGRRE